METMVVPATIRETIDGRRYLTYTEEIGRSSSEAEKEEFKGVLSSPRALFFALERGGGGGEGWQSGTRYFFLHGMKTGFNGTR